MGSRSEYDEKHSDELEEKEAFDLMDSPHVAEYQPKPKKPRCMGKYNFISRLLLLWVEPLFWTGCQHTLEQSDIYAHPDETDSEKLLGEFNRHWQTELDRKKRGGQPHLFLAVLKCLRWRLAFVGVVFFLEITILVCQSVLVGYLVDTFSGEPNRVASTRNDSVAEEAEESLQMIVTRNGYLFAAGIFVAALAVMFTHTHTFLMAYKIGMMGRILMTGAIYQKILSLSQDTIGKVSIGQIINLASNDVQRFDLAFIFFHIPWIAPLHLAVATYLVYIEVGWSAFLLLVFICFQIPLQVFLARYFAKLRFNSAVVTDNRVRVMNEVITGIRVIKMYAWEYAFKRVVANLRRKESWRILKAGLVRAGSLAFMISSLSLMMYIVFVSYAATGGVITPKKVFTTLSILIVLRLTTVHFVIQNILAIVEGRVAIARLQKLLEMDELDTKEKTTPAVGEISIVAKNLSASWCDNTDKMTLVDVDFTLTKDHRLLAVVGPVGSGKSTLLQCLLHELKPMEGSVVVNGRVSYASQDPWIYSDTLRDNILFGKAFEKDLYDRVIKACALEKDIELLVDGDLTLVGERGVTLSGGQKARVNLARAVYHDADIYLLDDPLSAVDAAVGKHIFEKCICELLKDRLVVLVTHQVHFALLADKILVLNDGRVEAYGSHSDLQSRGLNPQHLFGLISPEKDKDNRYSVDPDPQTEAPTRKRKVSRTDSPLLLHSKYRLKNLALERVYTHTQRHRRCSSIENLMISPIKTDDSLFDMAFSLPAPSLQSLHKATDLAPVAEKVMTKAEEVPRVSLRPEEDTNQGTISWKTYFRYFRAGGGLVLSVLVFLGLLLGELGIVVGDWWLADWATCPSRVGNSSPTCSLSTNERIYIYTGLTFSAAAMSFIRTLAFYYVCVNASKVLHNRMFKSILRAPVFFFDTNPVGRVLNRFSKDIGFLDDLLPYIFCEFILLGFRAMAIIGTALAANWWSILPGSVLLVGLLFTRWYYLKTSREVKRLEAIARSPVYSHLSTTLRGLPIVRSYGKQHMALQQFHRFQNTHTQDWYIYLVTTRWLGIKVDFLSAVFIGAVAFISVGLISFVSDPSLIGLSLSYAISLTGLFQYVIRQSGEVENTMISAERVMAYSHLESEASLETLPPNQKPSPDWPSKGELHMEDVDFQYSPDLPLVLKNLNFSVRPSEKVGIVGRTGAGKSSLLSVLYRLAEPFGHITIDGVDIKSIGLHDLRKKMSIIPQDPVLFSGTMRYNLDPFEEYSDAELWRVLEQVQLKTAVEELEGQLSGEVSEGGSNFSVGQRQLVCLARALLRNNKILILDEATANVDPKTDDIIQSTIRNNFSDCTVLTIAHRLNTIMDADKVLVMSDGQGVEFSSPLTLLQDKNSEFSKMVSKTGKTTSSHLYQMAVEANRRKNDSYP